MSCSPLNREDRVKVPSPPRLPQQARKIARTIKLATRGCGERKRERNAHSSLAPGITVPIMISRRRDRIEYSAANKWSNSREYGYHIGDRITSIYAMRVRVRRMRKTGQGKYRIDRNSPRRIIESRARVQDMRPFPATQRGDDVPSMRVCVTRLPPSPVFQQEFISKGGSWRQK